MEKTLRAALYVRVSTSEQIENYSIDSQQERLKAFCVSKGWIVKDIYIDPGFSGSNTDRPALQRMLADLKEIDVVVVYKLDRLSRSQRDTLDLIEEYFLKNNVEFVSITETIDTSTPFGKAMIGILSVFAQLERETITERMRMGLVKRAEEGYRTAGGNYDPAGYGRKDGELYVKEEEALHIKAAFDLYEQYHSITKVQKRLKELGYTVWRFRRYADILRAKLYCGYVSFAGTYYKGKHEPIITEEQFERVQVLLARHKGNNAHKAKESLLSGLITCGHENCGEKYLTYQSRDKVKKDKYYRYYICRARRFPSEYDEKCTNKIWNYQQLEEVIMEEIEHLLEAEKEDTDKKTDRVDYDKLIRKVDEKMERIIQLYAEGNIPVPLLNKQITALEAEKTQLQDKLHFQDMQQNTVISKEELKQYVLDLRSADFSTRQAIIQKLIGEIIIHDENVEIVRNF